MQFDSTSTHTKRNGASATSTMSSNCAVRVGVGDNSRDRAHGASLADRQFDFVRPRHHVCASNPPPSRADHGARFQLCGPVCHHRSFRAATRQARRRRGAIFSKSPARARASCSSAELARRPLPTCPVSCTSVARRSSADRRPTSSWSARGAWGGWTALNLRQMGAKVTIVDAYGPGNARSTSGDESRGVRSSYGDRPASSASSGCCGRARR